MGLNARRKPVNGSRLLLLGLAYKKNVGDIRESPAIEVAQNLAKLGADVAAVDPFADPFLLPPGIGLTGADQPENSPPPTQS